MPSSDIPRTRLINIPHFDKLVHFSMYFGFSFVVLWDFSAQKELTRKIVATILFVVISASGMIEIMQGLWSSGREADFYDLIANSAGAIVGTGVFFAILNHKKADTK